MSTFKKLNRQDVFVTSYSSKKEWTVFNAFYFPEYGITRNMADKGSLPLISGSADYENNLLYESINHLYYSNFSGSIITGSFENYIPSSLETGSRQLDDRNCVFSIPQNVYGTNIVPSTFQIDFLSGALSGSIVDNGEGKLFLQDSNFESLNNSFVGDILYSHGLVIITSSNLAYFVYQVEDIQLKWISNYPILTLNTVCKVHDYEFNVSQNPTTLISGSESQVKDFTTGSFFNPYITGIGLYNDANELLAVAKFGQPIPKSPYIDTSFIIKLDM